MSIASQISRLLSAKAAIKTAIQNKGVTVSDSAKIDTYASLIDSIPTGSSAWNKIYETTVTANITSTSSTSVTILNTGDSSLYTSSKFVWVRIRDTAGKRQGYFYGSDNFMANYYPINGLTNNTGVFTGYRYNFTPIGKFGYTTSTYGLWPSYLTKDGDISISGRYHSTNSYTIDGTYKIEVFLLEPADETPVYE